MSVESGDLLYIPNGWWHVVETGAHSISVTVQLYTAWDWMSVWPDRVLEYLHEWGLYRRGQCTCHTSAAQRVVRGIPP